MLMCLNDVYLNETESFLSKRINYIWLSIHTFPGTQHTVMQINTQ